jgi:hypothetical protein
MFFSSLFPSETPASAAQNSRNCYPALKAQYVLDIPPGVVLHRGGGRLGAAGHAGHAGVASPHALGLFHIQSSARPPCLDLDLPHPPRTTFAPPPPLPLVWNSVQLRRVSKRGLENGGWRMTAWHFYSLLSFNFPRDSSPLKHEPRQ